MAADDVKEWKRFRDWRKYVEQQAQRLSKTSAEEGTSPPATPAADDPSDKQVKTRQRKGKQRKPPVTKEDLLRRLMDPTLSLQEAAIILEVCPATVRRYADDGLLNCLRTDGNQRRFRLSDVLAFEEQLRHDRRRGPKDGKVSPFRLRPQPRKPGFTTTPAMRPPIRFSN
jgi:excisionase family DNA binding protein